MTHNISTQLQAHLDSQVTTMCYCWRITRTDGIVQGFTEHDEDLSFDGTTFLASSGFTTSQIQSNLGLAIDNLNVDGALSSDTLNENDLASGKYDDAFVELFWVNWSDPTQYIIKKAGYTGETQRFGLAFSAELRGLSSRLEQTQIRTYKRTCDAQVGDGRCKINLTNPIYQGEGTITEVSSPRIFKASGLEAFANTWFTQGVLTFKSNSNKRCLISAEGLMVNAYHDENGRDGYFAPPSGTSEGQFLGIYAFARAARRLPASSAKAATIFSNTANIMANAAWTTMYMGVKPSAVGISSLYIPHWLFAARSSIQMQNVHLADTHTFLAYGANQVSTILPDNTVKVYQAYDLSGDMLWNNPYSYILGGKSYNVVSLTHIGDNAGYRLVIDTGTSGDYKVAFTTSDGPIISEGTPYEAWPAWRKLAEGEIDCAADTLRWARDAFEELAILQSSNPEYQKALHLTVNAIPQAFAVDDGRAFFKKQAPNYGTGESGLYHFSPSRISNWTRNGNGYLEGVISSGSGESQLGRGYSIDLGAITDTIKVNININTANSATFLYIDLASSYSVSDRYYVELGRGIAGTKAIEIPLSDFRRIDGDSKPLTDRVLSFPLTIYGTGITYKDPAACNIVIREIRPMPVELLPYQPYICPFTVNLLNGSIIDWRGSPGSGYQAPDMWGSSSLNNPAAAEKQCDFLTDAQNQWVIDNGGTKGPLAHCYVWDRPDKSELGNVTPGTWIYTWHDPNSKWGGYQYRPFESCARLMYERGSSSNYVASVTKAKNLVVTFINYILSTWTSSLNGPPTDYRPTGVTTEYQEPHFAALILRMALYAVGSNKLTGSDLDKAKTLITKSWTYLDSLFVTTGVMKGTWSTDPNTLLWYGFWNAEIILTLAEMLSPSLNSIVTDLSIQNNIIESRIADNANWILTNTRQSGGNTGISIDVKSHTKEGNDTVIELWTRPAFDMIPGDFFSITAGCQQTVTMCRDKFHNLTNFRGFPAMPGADAVIRNPDPTAKNTGSTTTSSSK